MENSDSSKQVEQGSEAKNSGPLIIFIVALVLVIVAFWQFSTSQVDDTAVVEDNLVIEPPSLPASPPEVIIEEVIEPIQLPEVEVILEEIEIAEASTEVETIEEVVTPLPNLDDSDELIKSKLPELTWRNELLSLLITDDIIRRFVVFTDNFAQGLLAYEHSNFVKPKQKFTVDEKSQSVENKVNVWAWDPTTSKRFDLYVDLLRSIDSSTLVDLYIEIKPLIDEAYSELGYEDDFTYTLQDAITRVLDMEYPQSSMNLTRSSVMYKFEESEIEKLADSDKLLIRLGKENLLIIKSVLLELSEKLAKRNNIEA